MKNALVLLVALGGMSWAVDSPEVSLNKLEAAIRDGLLPQAIYQGKKAVNRHDDSAPLFNTLGVAYLMNGETADAVESFESAISCDASFAPAYANLADALLRMKQFEDAKREADNSLGLDPNNPAARVIKGEALDGLARKADALAEYRKAATIDAAFPMARYHLGMRAAKAKRVSEARRELGEFLRLERVSTSFKEPRLKARIAEAEATLKAL